MKKQKNLDELYQERLLGKEAPPPVDAWSNIAGRLHPKKEKTVLFPFWYKLAGVAASLLIIGTLAVNLWNSPSENTNFSTPQVATEDLPDFRDIEANAFESFNEQMLNTSKILEALLSEDRDVKNGKKHTGFSTAEAITSELEKSSEKSEILQQVHPTKGETEVTGLTESIPEENISEEKPFKERTSEEIALAFSKEEENMTISEEKGSKLSLSTKFAPLFNQNGESGAAGNSVAYGLSVTYKLSERLAVRSGVNKMNMNFGSREIDYTGGVQASIKGSTTALASPEVEKEKKNYGFIELPLELEYAVLDRKIKLNLIGGSSLLFLNEQPEAPTYSTLVANPKDNTTRELEYTGNLGIGLGYQIFEKLELNVEPMFKFRLRDSKSLSPYYFGIYSGFSYRF